MIFILFAIQLLGIILALSIATLIVLDMVGDVMSDAPFVGIPPEVVDSITNSFKLPPNSVLYDMGCGDGRVLLSAAKKYPQSSFIGVEIALLPYFLAKIKTRHFKNISIKRGNIFTTDIANATHFYIYLFPHVATKLFSDIKKQCKPGTKVFSADFMIAGETPTQTIDLSKIDSTSKLGKVMYVYVVNS
ncbi:MAG: methyltransferase [Parcubacteria group bacterium]